MFCLKKYRKFLRIILNDSKSGQFTSLHADTEYETHRLKDPESIAIDMQYVYPTFPEDRTLELNKWVKKQLHPETKKQCRTM